MILLDTNALLWVIEGSSKLGTRARHLIQRFLEEDAAYCSTVCFWEIAMLHRKNRLGNAPAAQDIRAELISHGLMEIEVSGSIAIFAGALEGLHGDPADRMIVATAVAKNLPLLTADRQILAWDGPLKTVDARL